MKLRGRITSVRACDEVKYGIAEGRHFQHRIRHGTIATIAVFGRPPLHTEIELPLTGTGIMPDLGVDLEITILQAKPKKRRK